MADIWRKFPPVMRHFFYERFREPAMWFERRLAYTRSIAVNSMAGVQACAQHCSAQRLAQTPAAHLEVAWAAWSAHQRRVTRCQSSAPRSAAPAFAMVRPYALMVVVAKVCIDPYRWTCCWDRPCHWARRSTQLQHPHPQAHGQRRPHRSWSRLRARPLPQHTGDGSVPAHPRHGRRDGHYWCPEPSLPLAVRVNVASGKSRDSSLACAQAVCDSLARCSSQLDGQAKVAMPTAAQAWRAQCGAAASRRCASCARIRSRC